jgi:hypothetical protein
LCADMATNVKPRFINHEQKLWIHNSIMHILQQSVAKTNSCCLIWSFQLMHSCYFIQTKFDFVAVKMYLQILHSMVSKPEQFTPSVTS